MELHDDKIKKFAPRGRFSGKLVVSHGSDTLINAAREEAGEISPKQLNGMLDSGKEA